MKNMLRKKQTVLFLLCFLNLFLVIEGGVSPALVRLRMLAEGGVIEGYNAALPISTNGLIMLERMFQSLTLYFIPIVVILSCVWLRDQFRQFLSIVIAGLLSYLIGGIVLLPVLCSGFSWADIHMYTFMGLISTVIVSTAGTIVLWLRNRKHQH